jgi:hypothetical protein
MVPSRAARIGLFVWTLRFGVRGSAPKFVLGMRWDGVAWEVPR